MPTSRHSHQRRQLGGRGALVAGLVGLALLAAPAAGEARSFIWKIEAPGQATCHLLGSIHLANKGFYPLAPAIEEAFKAAEVLVLEARVDQFGKLMGMLMQHAMYGDADSLDRHISARTMKLLRNRLKTSGLPAAMWMRMKPWVVAMTLSALELKKLGYNPEDGIDLHLLNRAKSGKKAIAELEGAEFQLKLFAGLGEKQQEQFLLYTLARSKLMQRRFERLIRLWKAGDHRKLHEQMVASLRRERQHRAIFKQLITDRNHSMTETLVKQMGAKKDKRQLFVVGAGHLTGPQGMVQLLRKRGLKLTQL